MKTPDFATDNNVIRKTPEEIKNGLAACSADECHGQHAGCTYQDQFFCTMRMCGDALAYIKQLESRLAKVERERDAAVHDIPTACIYCKFFIPKTYKCTNKLPCACISGTNTGWEWRGVCPENTKEESPCLSS